MQTVQISVTNNSNKLTEVFLLTSKMQNDKDIEVSYDNENLLKEIEKKPIQMDAFNYQFAEKRQMAQPIAFIHNQSSEVIHPIVLFSQLQFQTHLLQTNKVKWCFDATSSCIVVMVYANTTIHFTLMLSSQGANLKGVYENKVPDVTVFSFANKNTEIETVRSLRPADAIPIFKDEDSGNINMVGLCKKNKFKYVRIFGITNHDMPDSFKIHEENDDCRVYITKLYSSVHYFQTALIDVPLNELMRLKSEIEVSLQPQSKFWMIFSEEMISNELSYYEVLKENEKLKQILTENGIRYR